MNTVIPNLIFDRVEDDVLRVQELCIRLNMGMASPEEVQEWLKGMKGKYGYQDFNRVGSAVDYLDGVLSEYGYLSGAITPTTKWRVDSIPPASKIQEYLNNVINLRNSLQQKYPLPLNMENLDYTGANQIEETLTMLGEDIVHMEMVFPRSGVYPSSYVSYIPDESYSWEIVPLPQQVDSVIYNGFEQSPNWGVDISKYDVLSGGTGIDAGNYIAVIKPKHGYKWPDDSTAAKSFQWSIRKAQGIITLSPNTLTMLKQNWQDIILINYNGDGTVQFTQDNNNVLVTLLDRKLLLISRALGSTRITITAGEGKNYLAATPAICNITVADLIRSEPTSGQFYSNNVKYLPDIYR